MYTKIAEFFIKNSKLTLVLVIVSLLAWVWSYIMLPKQYNPSIIVPAFSITLPSYWLYSEEIANLIISPIENKLMEIEWIDEIFSQAWDNYAWFSVKFNVWIEKEKAKIRLTQKISELLLEKPDSIWNPQIKAIDPDELSQITYAISYNWTDLSEKDQYIYLKNIANIIKDKVKTIDNVTTLDIVWWFTKDIIISLDLDKIEARNTDIMQIYKALKENNIKLPSWKITWSENIFVWLDAKQNDIENIKKIVIANIQNQTLYLEDVADVSYWINKLNKNSLFYTADGKYNTVFLWIWKKIWSNAVFVTNDIKAKITEISKELPKNIILTIIQDEWVNATHATTMLMTNLFQSIVIVFLVLAFSLWVKNALNTSISIPLTLFSIFSIAYIIWDNINKITLFALILVLWMLVDDSTVVVENIERHFAIREKTWKTKLDAIKDAIQEVQVWVILSTVTRLFAFWAMFAVTWMMWEYMWPIPKYSLMASVISTTVALTVNPWISFNLSKDIDLSKKVEKKQKKASLFSKIYLKILWFFINTWKNTNKKIKILKISFWISLLLVMVLPIQFGIFKARMLPKSNQNQIYLWVDAPRWWTNTQMTEVNEYINDFLLNCSKKWECDESLNIVKNISSTIWQSFMWDFSNLFRWGIGRVWENQISSRINFIPKDYYKETYKKSRTTSETYTIQIRNKLREYVLEKYPDLKIKLLEDPPGPPVMATFMINIKSNWLKENIDKFAQKVKNEVLNTWGKLSVVDIYDSRSSTYKKINFKIDNEALTKANLTTQQVANTLQIILNGVDLNVLTNNWSEFSNLVLNVWKDQIDDISKLEKIYFTNNSWVKIPLSSIAETQYTFVNPNILTDNKEDVYSIYWEMWDDSLIYPITKLIKTFLNKNFYKDNYILKDWSLYKIDFIWKDDWKIYSIEWSWEWKLTLDTFRDLWIAMWLSLIAIYFLLVWQFSSFKIAWIIMITFLLWFFGVFPWFSILYLLKWEYFSATSMIWVITLAWIVVWNAIILIDYIHTLKANWLTIEDAILKAWYTRMTPVLLTSATTILWSFTIIWDPVWSGLAWTIIWGLTFSSILTLILIPIFYYDSQKKYWN